MGVGGSVHATNSNCKHLPHASPRARLQLAKNNLLAALIKNKVVRGWLGEVAKSDVQDDYDALPANHLVMVVHGIGESLW